MNKVLASAMLIAANLAYTEVNSNDYIGMTATNKSDTIWSNICADH